MGSQVGREEFSYFPFPDISLSLSLSSILTRTAATGSLNTWVYNSAFSTNTRIGVTEMSYFLEGICGIM